jgi:hypothetical protein
VSLPVLESSGELAAHLLREIRDGTCADWAELYHQACHQFGIHGDLAYAVVPHVVDIARHLSVQNRVWPLVIAGTVAGCRAAFPSRTPPIPDDLWADYEASSEPALLLATAALGKQVWKRGEVVELLGVVAAIQGHCDLAIHLFLHGGSDHDLSCPECGESIRWREGGEP